VIGRQSTFATALLLALAMLSGCGRQEPEAAKSRSSEGPPWSLPSPDLDRLEAAVMTQLQGIRAAAVTASEPGRSPGEAAEAIGNLGMHYEAYDFSESAESCYGHAVALDPTRHDWLRLHGRTLAALGRTEEAIVLFERALSQRPGDVPTLLDLGETQLERGESGTARDSFARALDLAPASTAVLYALGRAELADDEPASAARHLEEALRLEPRATAIHHPLGLALRGTGERERALEHLQLRGPTKPPLNDPLQDRIAALVGGMRVHQNRGSRLFEAGLLEEAAAEYRLAVQADPDDPLPLGNLGAVLVRLGHTDEGLEALAAALALSPDEVDVLFNLGTTLAALGRDDEALETFDHVLRQDVDHVAASVNAGNALRRLGRFEEALPHYRVAIRVEPGNATYRLAEVLTLARLGRHAESLAATVTALQVSPGDPALRQALARLSAASADRSLRDPGRAIEVAQQLLAEERNIENGVILAMALASSGSFDEAAALQEQVAAAAANAGAVDLARELATDAARYQRGESLDAPWPADHPAISPRRSPSGEPSTPAK